MRVPSAEAESTVRRRRQVLVIPPPVPQAHSLAGERRVEIHDDGDLSADVDVLVVVPAVLRRHDAVADEDELRVGDAREVDVRVGIDAEVGLDAVQRGQLDLAPAALEGYLMGRTPVQRDEWNGLEERGG